MKKIAFCAGSWQYMQKLKIHSWCTDFTYLYLSDGTKCYKCSIINLYDKSIVATFNGKRIDAALAIDTLKTALQKNKTGKGLILHSDQGSHFTSRDFPFIQAICFDIFQSHIHHPSNSENKTSRNSSLAYFSLHGV